ncbi:multiple epidermal growth factor-like domains protein 10 [Haliotis rufescens]|uniref:multiple epidermal growth factor-like domains protein 10 n=1 Tax=Haliotis rufescens TaxID=6454 RepID=UPI00201F6FCC|nr:multiple epidermal growth factor-like domains protein 10 [Haliotis rufescens]
MATQSAVIAVTAHIIVLTHACTDPTNCIKLNHVDTTGKPTCELGCIDGWSGDCCRQHCLDRCIACSSRNTRECSKYESGRYGIRCEDLCGQCHKGNCSINGTCHDGCKPGFWGTRCSHPCSQHCKDEEMDSHCEHHTGHCIYGCKDGYFGGSCDAMCPDDCEGCNSTSRECKICNDGFYGIECYHPCPQNCKQCLDSNTTCKTCSDEDGMCSIGCTYGFYGPTCNQTCPQNCRYCNESDVSCLKCGREDGECSQGCRKGYYGRHCQHTCPENCLQCNTTRDCDECMVSQRGSNCTLVCHTCPSVRCLPDGNCTLECKDGITGDRCDITTETKVSHKDVFGYISELIKNNGYFLPFLASALALLIALCGFLFWRCRKIHRDRAASLPTCGYSDVMHSTEETVHKSGDIYDEIIDEDLHIDHIEMKPLFLSGPKLPAPPHAGSTDVDDDYTLSTDTDTQEVTVCQQGSSGYITPRQNLSGEGDYPEVPAAVSGNVPGETDNRTVIQRGAQMEQKVDLSTISAKVEVVTLSQAIIPGTRRITEDYLNLRRSDEPNSLEMSLVSIVNVYSQCNGNVHQQ